MVMGITYEGEIARVGAGKDPQQTVELICTDPRFVELASAKKPNFIIRLFNGALSFPRDWWYRTTFLATRANFFDAEGRAATDGTARTATDLIMTGLNNPWLFVRTIRLVLGHLVHYPEFYGRMGAALATTVALTAIGAPFVMPIGLVNFFLSATGSVLRAIDNGATSLAEIVIAAAIGESDPELARRVAQQIAVPKHNDYKLSSEEEDYMVHIMKGVLYCIRNPGEMMNASEPRQRQTTVPVGRVSSMRPRGVMGSIPWGHETNALDAISEDLNNWGRNPDY